MSTLQEKRLVLHLKSVTFSGGGRRIRDAISLSFPVRGGDLLFLRGERAGQARAIFDLCSGLTPPFGGSVHFLGRDWEGVQPDIANAMRGRIGRVFSRGSWIEDVTIQENILLPELHHTRRPIREVRQEAGRLALQLGLPGIPLGYPADLPLSDLNRAAWIRAFLGNPSLILLEEPTSQLGERDVAPLIALIREARDRGAAVVWVTLNDSLWRDPSIPVTRRYRLIGRRLIEVENR
jgi:phospholipid/cholesterol/gamma-HCH transport system ATP-binding protein